MVLCVLPVEFFFFNDTATTEIYTLSLHDALPISIYLGRDKEIGTLAPGKKADIVLIDGDLDKDIKAIRNTEIVRSEEHTSELQSQSNIVCRLLLEKKKKQPQSEAQPPVTRGTAVL